MVIVYCPLYFILVCLCALRVPCGESYVAKNFLSGVLSTCAKHTAAWMARCAAKIQSADWCAMVGPSSDGTEAEELMSAHRALHDVAAGDAERALQIERRQDLAMLDRARHVRGVFGEHFNAAVAECF